MQLVKDVWRIGMARARVGDLLAGDARLDSDVRWWPETDFPQYAADPFGLWRDGLLHVFHEAYDYRSRKGVIALRSFDAELRPIGASVVLEEPWHLSYPVVLEDEDEVYMLPEAHRSGRLTLYRALDFPNRWEACAVIALPGVGIDATPCRFEGRWWLFYAPAGSAAERLGTLHVAHAPSLKGPWAPHPGNPVRRDPSSSRPGGLPFMREGALTLPMQDCRVTYGGGLRPLVIDALTPTDFAAHAGPPLSAPHAFAPYDKGLHTLNGAGDVALFDVKRREISAATLALDARRQLRHGLGRLGLRAASERPVI